MAVEPTSSFFTENGQLFDRIKTNKAAFYSQVLDRIENKPAFQAAYEGSIPFARSKTYTNARGS
jgi:hypothetical protein